MIRNLASVFLVVALALTACGSDDPGPLIRDDSSTDAATYSYLIPAGAGEAIDSGEPLDILPRELDVRVGELFELINLDDRGHLVGPFFVGAGRLSGNVLARPERSSAPARCIRQGRLF